MQPTTVTLQRFEPMHGWANRILRVDLSAMRIWAQETAPYVPNYLGARGIAARICWDEYPEPVPPFDPANPLMVMTGALTGSRSPYSGRTNVCAFSPQASPYPWFTRSSIGGHFGGELKRAGYDGIVVTGASDTPVCIRVRDDEVAILPAGDLWGLDIMDCLEALEGQQGKGTRAMVIGSAGERLSHIATIQTASSSAAGQGGFGGVMGSKKLKAIAVAGTGQVSLARPDTIASLARTLAPMLGERVPRGPRFFGGDLQKLNEQLVAEGNGSARCQACTEGCLTPCQAYFKDVPGAAYSHQWSGSWFCVAAIVLPGSSDSDSEPRRSAWDWTLVRRAAFEMNVLSNRYGLNQFDLLMGMVPWLLACQKAGLISDVNGQEIFWHSPHFWAEFLRIVRYREGIGDVLARGGWAAAKDLHLGEDIAAARYPGWGHTGHWGGHDELRLYFPYWLVPALQWMCDTRDPFNSGHGSLWVPFAVMSSLSADPGAEGGAVIGQARSVGDSLHGDADAFDPRSGYQDKAAAAHFFSVRPIIKDCVPVDDLVFPLIWRDTAPDRLWHLSDIDGVGDIDGLSVEYHLFKSGTGVPWPEEEFDRAAERVCTLERALQVRHWGRDRATDELVLPYFERPETYQNPLLDRRYGLDREQFAPVMDEFYRLHGWDPATARPTAERLRELDLADLYQPMVEGAERAEAARGE